MPQAAEKKVLTINPLAPPWRRCEPLSWTWVTRQISAKKSCHSDLYFKNVTIFQRSQNISSQINMIQHKTAFLYVFVSFSSPPTATEHASVAASSSSSCSNLFEYFLREFCRWLFRCVAVVNQGDRFPDWRGANTVFLPLWAKERERESSQCPVIWQMFVPFCRRKSGLRRTLNVVVGCEQLFSSNELWLYGVKFTSRWDPAIRPY